jgi:hypothetical protein
LASRLRDPRLVGFAASAATLPASDGLGHHNSNTIGAYHASIGAVTVVYDRRLSAAQAARLSLPGTRLARLIHGSFACSVSARSSSPSDSVSAACTA